MRVLIAESRVQICHHRIHLLLRHLICKRRHRSLPSYQDLLNLCIRCRLTIRQCVSAEYAVQTRWNLLQVQIVFLVTVRTADVV